MQGRLSALQRDVLREFSRLAPEFFLTGGAALAGFHLGHRVTEDLDLFVTTDRLQDGAAALQEAARILGASVQAVTTGPHHRRFLVRRGNEGIVVDLVHDPSPQVVPDKPLHDGLAVDPPMEILANKLCALLSRSEVRDLVDVEALEKAGHDLEQALPLAARKDTGFSAAQLAWVLHDLKIAPDARGLAGRPAAELVAYRDALCKRLQRLARPT
jgi:hypothetical protein